MSKNGALYSIIEQSWLNKNIVERELILNRICLDQKSRRFFSSN